MSHFTQPDDWRSAWRRVNRSYTALSGQYPNSEEYDDALYHFFQDAWHLKDWLQQDPGEAARVTGLQDELKKYPSLMIAADLANGTKHRLLSHIRSGARIVEKHHIIRVGHPEPVKQIRYLELRDGSKKDAADAAAEALADWRRIFAALGLDPDQ